MVSDLQLQIHDLKATVKAAAEHPFLPMPARLAIVQACAVIETIAAELHRVSELLGDDLDVIDARMARRFAR